MKRILSTAGIFTAIWIGFSAFATNGDLQDPPRTEKKKRIKMVKVDDQGNRIELDTTLGNENFIVFDGDTVFIEKEMKWATKGDIDFDFDLDMEELKMLNEEKLIELESMLEGLPKGMKWHPKKGESLIVPPHPAGKRIMIQKLHQGNVIDLSDPGIISYQKKDLKDGKEKIVIVREKPTESDKRTDNGYIQRGEGPVHLKGGIPKVKEIKVIRGNDGLVEIIENGQVKELSKGESEGMFISDDGDVVTIKESKKGGKKEVEVTVETINEEKEKEPGK